MKSRLTAAEKKQLKQKVNSLKKASKTWKIDSEQQIGAISPPNETKESSSGKKHRRRITQSKDKNPAGVTHFNKIKERCLRRSCEVTKYLATFGKNYGSPNLARFDLTFRCMKFLKAAISLQQVNLLTIGSNLNTNSLKQ